MMYLPRLLVLTLALGLANSASFAEEKDPVSYAADVRPVLAANCFGCHQGARNEGGYVMTGFDSLLAGGDSGLAAVVPGEPDSSYLVELISVHDGVSQMPPDSPLSSEDISTIRSWIEQGAKNDYARITAEYSEENPPPYSRQPNITSVAWSPDGKWLAINGFHEILIYDTSELIQPTTDKTTTGNFGKIARRLCGLSARVESICFSPDGKRLAASGGNPAEFGEVQIWDVASGELQLSKIVSHDTVYGVSWSPDGKLVSFGCTDTTLRAIDSVSGEQVLYQTVHEDWIRDTVFSVDGSQLVSVGRDMTCKLVEVSTQRFIDNITSITPGVLKGGIASVARHPTRDEIVIGGADGIPKIYRMNRITKRVIGDDANLVRLLPPMPGRIQAVTVSRDGKRIAAVSSLDGQGAVHVYSSEFDSTVSDELKALLARQPRTWKPEERAIVEAYHNADVGQIAAHNVDGGLYTVEFSPDGTRFVTGGAEGIVRIYETETGNFLREFNPVAITTNNNHDPNTLIRNRGWGFAAAESSARKSTAPASAVSLSVFPEKINFTSPTDYVQLVVQANLADGSTINIRDLDQPAETDASVVRADGLFIQPHSEGDTEILLTASGHSITIPVHVDFPETPFTPKFRHDVNPVLTKLGCNAGTCHGSQDGKMGFKLSLRGYDSVFDIRAFTDDMGSRRTNLASPADSLMLAKPTATVPHSGGQLIDVNSKYHKIIYEWVRSGARLDPDSPKVVSVELFPENPILIDNASLQQMRLVANYSDGSSRDVTREGFIEIGDQEIAQLEGSVIQATRRGETPVLARYEGAFTATTLTVMGDRAGFVWNEPESWGKIDDLVAEKWRRMKIQPSELCDDQEFIRRVYLDLTGLPPTADDVSNFLADTRPTRIKRDELVDELTGNDSYVEHWSNKWADMLQVNRKYLGPDGARAFRDWIRDQVRENRPYDEFTYDILTATGSNRENPAASWFKIHRTPVDTMESTTHLFLGTRFNCNKCHDHPFERWTQDQYFQTAAFFSQVSLTRDPASGDKNVGGSAVEKAQPLYEVVADTGDGNITHDRTGEIVEPEFPFVCDYNVNENAPRRAQLASWMTSPDNLYFATSYVNRVWGYLLGTGLIEPLDDIRAGNPPSNPQLLEYLRSEFVEHDFDVRHIMKLICKSRVYQLSVKTNPFNADDRLNYSHAAARRLPAEVLYDAIHFVTGSDPDIPGVKPGTRAAALPDSGARLPSGFLSTLGRPARESVCECERSSELQLGSVLALVSGPDVARAIDNPENAIADLVAGEADDRKLVADLYLRILNRMPAETEIDAALETLATLGSDHQSLVEQRDLRKKFVDEQLPKLKAKRLLAIQSAASELKSVINKIDPDIVQKEIDRETAITSAQNTLTEYADSPDGIAAWTRRQLETIHWHPIVVTGFQSAIERPYTIQDDRSILLGQKTGADVYTVTSKTDLNGISAIRLELRSEETLPAEGPGLAENGNLVLTEFEFEIAHPDKPDVWTKVEFETAIANHEQADYPITTAIDGVTDDNRGWALLGNLGKTNWATMQLKMPIGYSAGTLLRFRLHQNYDDRHQVGHFRISLTRNQQPVGLGLPEFLLAQVARPADQRDPDINARLMAAFRKSDPRFAELESALAEARKPLMIDPEIIRLREKLERVSQPVPEDSLLMQLTRDAEYSESQMTNHRLTAAQDLAWALINSPSFLFNR